MWSLLGNNLKLTGKFLPPILVGCVVAMMLGTAVITKVVKKATHHQSEVAQEALAKEQESAHAFASEALNAKADIIGHFMARTAPDLIVSYDFASLKDYQADATRDKDILYAAYLKPNGETLTEYKIPQNTSDIEEKHYPVILDGEKLGSILLGVSTESVNRIITESNSRINSAIGEVNASSEEAMTSFNIVSALQVLGVLFIVSSIILFMFRRAVINPTKETIYLIKQLSKGNGDLSQQLPIQNNDEISELRQSVNEFIQQLRTMIATISNEVDVLTTEANEVRQHGLGLSVTADSQQMEATQAATAMNEMVANVQEVARSTTAAADAANKADTQAKDGNNIVTETTDTIDQLASQVEYTAEAIESLAKDTVSIGLVLDVIKDIAEQTNLLALNAAIEAARAGEQGRGFAVVADEVRTLASRTQKSTLEIQEMIQSLQAGAQNAVSAMEKGREQAKLGVDHVSEAGSALNTISNTVYLIHDMNSQIAAASEQQAAVAEEINRNIDRIKQTSDQTADSAKQFDQSSENLFNVASQLEKMVGQFKI